MTEKINPQALKPAHLMRLLNTAGFGTVLTEHRLRRHRNRAGYAIGTEKTVNLFQYAAWLGRTRYEIVDENGFKITGDTALRQKIELRAAIASV